MSETNNNSLKTSEKQITLSSDKMWFYNFIGDDFYKTPENYTIGVVKTSIDKTIPFTAPKSTNNAFYDEMLTAEEVEINTFIHTGIGVELESWYKIRTNASSAHLNNGKGVYNIIVYSGNETRPNKFIYDINGEFVASDVTGSQQTSVSLDFGQTYYVRLSGIEPGPLTLIVSYDNVGGQTGNFTTEIVNNSLCIDYSGCGLVKNERIKKAELTLYKEPSSGINENNFKLGAFDYDQGVNPGCSIAEHGDLFDCVKISQANDEEVVAYTFDITEFFEKAVEQGCYNYLLVKAINNNSQDDNYITIYGKNSQYAPKVTITCESNYGVNTNYRSDSHELGRFGQGSIDLQYGNLMFESEDFAWGGNRMPVTIKHLYNSLLYNQQYNKNSSIGLNTAEFGAMKLGLGFKLNIMQSMVEVTSEKKYIYTGENGEELYFMSTEDKNIYKTSEDDGELEYNKNTRILDNGDKYLFDEYGRLIKITDENNNSIEIEYTDNRITTVKDAVNRVFAFGYDANGFLTSITAPDGTQITYTYASDLLTAVNYPNGKSAQITYTDKKPTAVTLYDNGAPVQKMQYTFSNYAVSEVVEYGYKDGVSQEGIKKEYTYSQSAGRTIVHSSEDLLNTVYVFNDDGEVTNEYIKPQFSATTPVQEGKGVTIVNNILVGHDFERYEDNWYEETANAGNLSFKLEENEKEAVYGKSYLRITSNNSSAVRNGIHQCRYMPNGNFTLSAYMRVVSGFEGENDGAYLSIYHAGETDAIVNSEKLKIPSNEFVRLSVTWDGGDSGYCAAIMLDGEGVIDVNAPQLEYNADANSYNMISNSGLYDGKDWSLANATHDGEEGFCLSGSLKIEGDLDSEKSSGQAVTVKSAKSTRETFKLSGWAKGYALPNHDNADGKNPTFRLRAVINYEDKTTNETPITADFCPYISDWQYASVEFSKDAFKEVENIQVFCDYDYNYNYAHFDDIELIRTSIETGLKEEDFAVEDDNYTDESGTATEGVQAHTDETEELNAFNELVDAFGNTLTETTFTDGEFGTIYRSFGYDEDGNNLVKETDARGYTTQYVVDKTTSQNKEVTDRLGNKTVYEYDQSGRTTKVTSKNAKNREIGTVSYAYNSYDDLTEIVRGDGLKYLLKYNAFRNLESIGIDGKEDGDLITYTYKTGSGRLTSMTYANGDKMTATYDGMGNMIAERWVDKDGNQTAYYQYGYNAQGEIVRTVDKVENKLYNYTYEDGRIVRATESDVTIDDCYNLINSKKVISTISYTYDSEGTLTQKRITSNNSEQVITYTTAENESQLVKTTVGEHSFVSISKNDSFGRKEFDELQLGSGFVSRQFDYLNGAVTDEHKDNKLLKSTPTTQLVSEITFSDGRTIDYEYDAEEHITKVTDSVDGITRYTYDALGQLLTETKNGQLINSMIYDRYGNILHKNGIDYGYNGIWKDRLSHYDGKEITYDAQGNPVKYLDHILFWEKGRQLKSFDNSVYTYNANGIRTSKTVDGIRHDFYLDGGKILKEAWLDNTLETVFDNEDSVCGIVYNGEPFYFQKNLQGDIIGITDQNANVVVRYSYDAWGKCTITRAINGVIAKINPFRYRGYYFDSETGLYYLQSRYYDPVVGRFINGDAVEFATVLDNPLQQNLFSYCCNNCVNESDLYGNLSISSLISIVSSVLELFLALDHSYTSNTRAYRNLDKKIKNAKNRKQRREIVRQQKSLLKKRTGNKLFWVITIISFIAIVTPFIKYIINWGTDKIIFIEFIVSMILEAISFALCELTDWLMRLIPSVGILLGFLASFFIGKLFSSYFNDKKISRISNYYNKNIKKMKNIKQWLYSFKYALKA